MRETKLQTHRAEVLIIGGGPAGLSAAIYLGRAMRGTVLISHGKSMARWEPDVQNYLGFPKGIAGGELVRRGREQALRFGAAIFADTIVQASRGRAQGFILHGEAARYSGEKLMLATGNFHVPPEIPGVRECLGHSMFFCKDCDGYRVQGKAIAIYGWTNEAARYSLAMLQYADCVFIVTDGRQPNWDKQHSNWVVENHIPVYPQLIRNTLRQGGFLEGLQLEDGTVLEVQALFTTRGDVYYNELATQLGAKLDKEGQVIVNEDMETAVAGLYAVGCVTPANCQMIVAAGQGAIAAQAINRTLLDEALRSHSLHRQRSETVGKKRTRPAVRRSSRTSTPVAKSRQRRASVRLLHV